MIEDRLVSDRDLDDLPFSTRENISLLDAATYCQCLYTL